MWDDIKIGEGNKLNSAWHAYKVPDGPSISHNPVSYWISECVLGIGVTIMKDTQEGAELAALLAPTDRDAPDALAIKNWLDALVFRNADPKMLTIRLESALKNAFHAGQAAKAEEVCRVLGIER